MVVQPMEASDPEEISGYVLQGRLGTGGMGTVYLSSTRGGQPVAVKTVRPDLARDSRFRQRFEQEVQAARQVRGRYIANVLDSNTEGPLPWLVTEYVPGVSLAQALSGHGPLPVRACLGLAAGIANALEVIHAARIIHRDLKPGNVVLTQDGLAVIDFGIARAADATSLTGTNTRIGTPAFMAPEQIKRDAPTTSASDIFSLGVTVHVAATDVHPFRDEMFAAIPYLQDSDPDLTACPEPLQPIIGRCLAKDPADRPTATEVVAMCREVGRHLGLAEVLPAAGWLPQQFTVVSAPVPKFPPPPARDSSVPPATSPPSGAFRKRIAMALAALVAAGAAAFVVWAAPWDSDEGDHPPESKQPSREASAPESPAEKPRNTVESARHLKDRVKMGLKDCKYAEDLYEVDGANVTLTCTPQYGKGAGITESEANGITVHTASFSSQKKYASFLRREEGEVRDDGKRAKLKDPSTITLGVDDFPYKGPVANDQGVEIGRVFSHEDAYGSSTISWTFENDYYVDAHDECFIVQAESRDRESLVNWWNTWPL